MGIFRTDRRLNIIIGFALLLAFTWICVLTVVTTSYDGGIRCFLNPRTCNRISDKYYTKDGNLIPRGGQWTQPAPVGALPTATLRATPTQFLTPTPEDTTTVVTLPYREEELENADCGANPYNYNDFKARHERVFSLWCYPYTNDPFEVVFSGYDYIGVVTILNMMGLATGDYEYQVSRLESYGLWDSDCECDPELTTLQAAVQEAVEIQEELGAKPD